MSTSPVPKTGQVPKSGDDRITLDPLGPEGAELIITLKPVGLFEQASLEFDVNKMAPVPCGLQQIRDRIIETVRDGDLIEEPDRERTAELLTRHYDALFQVAGEEAASLSASERRQAESIIVDVQMTEPDVAKMSALLSHRMTAQSILASAYCIDTVLHKTDKSVWPLEVKAGRLTDNCLASIAKHIGRADFAICNLSAYRMAYMTEMIAKNSDAPSKSNSKPKTSKSTTSGSETKAA